MALMIAGERSTGNNVRSQNVMAASAVANIVKSSLGPVGLDKMLVDDVGDVTITNDGATILKLLEVEHPAAKILCELAQLQDEEVGDGTTSVVIIAAELLKGAQELVRQKIHPTSIISGYRLACKEACRYIQDVLTTRVDSLPPDTLSNVATTSMSSKLIGADRDFFSQLVVEACRLVKHEVGGGAVASGDGGGSTAAGSESESGANTAQTTGDGKSGKAAKVAPTKVPIKSINILKAHGQGAKESVLVEGYALNCTVASQAMIKRVTPAKICLLDFSLNKAKMMMGVEVLVSDPEKLEAIRQREYDITKERIEKILATGANVILTTGGIDDLCLKYFVEAGAMAVRRCKKVDLKRIAKATGATLCMSLANTEGEGGSESFHATLLGNAEEVVQERVGDDELILVKKCKVRPACSIILRGANDFMLDEMERSIHDALCVVKRVLESRTVVPGGGAVEAALSIYLENLATTCASREQLAIAEFAHSLLVIPKTLAVNAARDSTELVSKLRAYHNTAQTKEEHKELRWFGLELTEGVVRDNKKAGVLEPTMSKIKSLKFATEAAITILRIDDMIKLQPDPPKGRGDDDDCM